MEDFIDIHTHQLSEKANALSIKNIIANQSIFPIKKGFYSMGLHPWYLNQENKLTDLEILEALAKNKNVLAIGEIGLDKICKTDFDLQIEIFERQILIAEKLNKPIVIHCVKAFSELISIKKTLRPKVPMIVHGFNQNRQILDQLIAHQFYISLGSVILNEKSNAFKLIGYIPKNHLFLETDTSSISIIEIYNKSVEILQIADYELIDVMKSNFKKVFQRSNMAI
ncbi:MAG: TatD family hydrolase [Bacteroidota bacterium]